MKTPRALAWLIPLVLFAFAPLLVHAADLNVAWKNPTTFNDGSAMAATEITGASISCGLSQTNLTLFLTVTGQAQSATVTGAQSGKTYVCGVSTNSKSNGSSVMAFSNTGTTPTPKPSPPTGVTLTVSPSDPTAYSFIKSEGQVVMLPVGKIAAGTQCDGSQGAFVGGKTYNVVPVSAVTWSGSARPIVTFSVCG